MCSCAFSLLSDNANLDVTLNSLMGDDVKDPPALSDLPAFLRQEPKVHLPVVSAVADEDRPSWVDCDATAGAHTLDLMVLLQSVVSGSDRGAGQNTMHLIVDSMILKKKSFVGFWLANHPSCR